ncbi:membrane-bound PQQ-dependent dehydrogenase, glucose/quinate/shikimate family [Luteibacter aegosomaticola]|uniref:membrane-bound PQQ-dependent dehydrogenase, glucose/quinate/shikimate family n=1 Tax=Luteibacter aegosomaticola TaxID=2911538 RepID=UPI001FF938A6|nr:membrane-bound PQQ-dependent dehydrogenase, glucose/quinate/shikimate family [Luteibacter aegosomaticola]UPG92154.1 membrane-bound PQQ-dependent dehydrogenase, glucose/quinate/shikimate family [Luteibacter aegosomaticola]
MNSPESALARWGRWLLALVLGLFGLFMVIGGAKLISLGGNWYYAIAGLLSLASAITLARRRPSATLWFGVLFVLTLLWTIWEAGADYWGWVPRFALTLIFAILFSLLLPNLHQHLKRSVARLTTAVLLLAFVIAGGLAFVPHHVTAASNVPAAGDNPFTADTGPSTESGIPSTDWPAYGGNQAAQRYSSATQITPANVKDLQVAWTAKVGDVPTDTRWGVQNTPLKIGNMVYVCGYLNKVEALDAATGEKKWEFDPGITPKSVPYTPSCRSMSFYQDPASTTATANTGTPDAAAPAPATGAMCDSRIILGTLDARVIELDAKTGARCTDFGTNGEVSLTTDMGKVYHGYVAITSPPVVIRDTIVVGHTTVDGQRAFGPAGVTKAYNVKTGELKWAWDAADPTHPEPRQGDDLYKRGSPDVWTSFTGDNKLGLVFLPVANASGDYYSSSRTADENKYSPSLTAIDVETGLPRWSFQNTHDDVWDYDPGSPPTLLDYPQADGTKVPAIIFPTKNGEFYVLNRETGKSLFGVEERPVPQGGFEPAARSKTQPFSKFNSVAQPDLKPENMWGLSPLDQLVCRIQFAEADYRGKFTPPDVKKPIIDYPGYNGGVDWGGVSFDPARGLIISNYNDMPNYTTLVPRAEADKLGWKARDILNDPVQEARAEGAGDPQEGIPVAVNVNAGWQLPATGMLCKEPPYGGIRAIDIRDGRTVWDRPFGTARENGPFGLPTGLPIQIGTPNNGGSVITKSGLVFIAAATDNLIRAIDITTGETIWSAPLPAGAQAMPMVYEQDGREFVVITATGHHFMHTPKGNYVVAYALPKH